ncbi:MULTISPECIES: alpha-amylase family protein [unclassified Oceanispirochaeta]|uniref:alpha-amylase family protein n=1 Tax=unclassified Oceanispirochaeta TaxID=2635722 RepID=UPI000E09D04D|nr:MULTISPECIES: alpha-amylase family protein [unclassified Oceanispirochaeta]MBF9016552.1 beta-galactosidase [Oceanispirochaeta sp. M2]NPD73014.1 hypothetical protein [Oceanispirochaeta sp. M1]RDG31359.1 hypothetical protein DV872_12975 [Oceanispirochaeta sp. M1]
MNLNTSKKRIFFDMHFPEWEGQGIAEAFSPEHIASEMSNAGVDSVIAFAKCQYGNFYYNTSEGHKHKGLKTQNLLLELTESLAERNIATIAYYSVSWDEREAEKHPDWLVENFHGTRGNLEFTRWKTLCINSPYKDVVMRQLSEIAGQPGLKGLWIDMTIIGNDCCFCPHCLEQYKKKTGRDLKGDFLNDIISFKKFRYDYIEKFYSEIYTLIRRVNPELKITNNYWGYPYSSYNMGSRAIGALTEADYVTGEAYTDWTGILAPAIFTRFLRGVAKDRPFEALLGRFNNTWDYTRKPALQLALECFSVFSQGGTVTIDDEPYADGSIDNELYRNELKQIFSQMDKFAHCIQGEREKFAAIYHSQKSKDLEKDENAFIRKISGSFKLLYDMNFPVDFVFDELIDKAEDLSSYALIILPEVLLFNENEKEIFLDYTRSGGHILSFGNCGFDESFWNEMKIKQIKKTDDEISYFSMPSFQAAPLMVRGFFQPYEALSQDVRTSGSILRPIRGKKPNDFFHNNLPAPGQDSGWPGLLTRNYGKGGCTFLPQALAFHYAKQPLRPYRDLIQNHLKSLELTPRISIIASKRPDFVIYDQGENIYIHIMVPGSDPQVCCGLMDSMDGNFERPYELMEETMPVLNIQIDLSSLNGRLEIESLVENNTIELKQEGAFHIMVIDKITLWDIIRIKVK